MPRASLEKVPREVAAMFDEVAPRYDRTNSVLSFGQVGRWRAVVVQALDLSAGDTLLDLAAGTATSSQPFAAAGVHTVACDFSLGMLRVGMERVGTERVGAERVAGASGQNLGLVAGDATRLPFADGAFDATSISFGLRNVVDTAAALREMLRVTRHGGRLVVCEFSLPTVAPLRTLYTEYLMRALPSVARRVSSSPDSYVYLAESIRAWPDQRGLAQVIRTAGWDDVAYRNLTGGIVALHRATRP